MDEIQITIVIYISNLGKSIDAGNEVDTAVPGLKCSGLAIALVDRFFGAYRGRPSLLEWLLS